MILSLPFGSFEPALRLGSLGLGFTGAAEALAVGALAWEAVRRNARFDAASWAAAIWCAAWLVAALGTPLAPSAAAGEAWRLSAGALVFALARPVLDERERRLVALMLTLAGLFAVAWRLAASRWASLPPPAPFATTAGAAAFSCIAAFPLLAGPRLPRAAAWGLTAVLAAAAAAFLAAAAPHPEPWAAADLAGRWWKGMGPAMKPGLPLGPGLLVQGGLLAVAAALGIAAALLYRAASLLRKRQTRPCGRAALGLLAALALSAAWANPLRNAALAGACWLAAAVLFPPSATPYNARRRR